MRDYELLILVVVAAVAVFSITTLSGGVRSVGAAVEMDMDDPGDDSPFNPPSGPGNFRPEGPGVPSPPPSDPDDPNNCATDTMESTWYNFCEMFEGDPTQEEMDASCSQECRVYGCIGGQFESTIFDDNYYFNTCDCECHGGSYMTISTLCTRYQMSFHICNPGDDPRCQYQANTICSEVDPVCGDGVIEGLEVCDGDQFIRINTCEPDQVHTCIDNCRDTECVDDDNGNVDPPVFRGGGGTPPPIPWEIEQDDGDDVDCSDYEEFDNPCHPAIPPRCRPRTCDGE